jgi:hypothetical protein
MGRVILPRVQFRTGGFRNQRLPKRVPPKPSSGLKELEFIMGALSDSGIPITHDQRSEAADKFAAASTGIKGQVQQKEADARQEAALTALGAEVGGVPQEAGAPPGQQERGHGIIARRWAPPDPLVSEIPAPGAGTLGGMAERDARRAAIEQVATGVPPGRIPIRTEALMEPGPPSGVAGRPDAPPQIYAGTVIPRWVRDLVMRGYGGEVLPDEIARMMQMGAIVDQSVREDGSRVDEGKLPHGLRYSRDPGTGVTTVDQAELVNYALWGLSNAKSKHEPQAVNVTVPQMNPETGAVGVHDYTEQMSYRGPAPVAGPPPPPVTPAPAPPVVRAPALPVAAPVAPRAPALGGYDVQRAMLAEEYASRQRSMVPEDLTGASTAELGALMKLARGPEEVRRILRAARAAPAPAATGMMDLLTGGPTRRAETQVAKEFKAPGESKRSLALDMMRLEKYAAEIAKLTDPNLKAKLAADVRLVRARAALKERRLGRISRIPKSGKKDVDRYLMNWLRDHSDRENGTGQYSPEAVDAAILEERGLASGGGLMTPDPGETESITDADRERWSGARYKLRTGPFAPDTPKTISGAAEVYGVGKDMAKVMGKFALVEARESAASAAATGRLEAATTKDDRAKVAAKLLADARLQAAKVAAADVARETQRVRLQIAKLKGSIEGANIKKEGGSLTRTETAQLASDVVELESLEATGIPSGVKVISVESYRKKPKVPEGR